MLKSEWVIGMCQVLVSTPSSVAVVLIIAEERCAASEMKRAKYHTCLKMKILMRSQLYWSVLRFQVIEEMIFWYLIKLLLNILVSDLFTGVLAIGPSDNTCPYAYRGKAVFVRCLWSKVCSKRWTETSHQSEYCQLSWRLRKITASLRTSLYAFVSFRSRFSSLICIP